MTNVATELNNKLSTTSTLLTNTAVVWSSGLANDGCHTINGGTDALCFQTNSGMVAFNVLGSVAGSQEGQTLFYKSVSMPSLSINATGDSTLNLKSVNETASIF